jgi:hypothetical protein
MYITDYSAQTASGWGLKLNSVSLLNNLIGLQQHPLICDSDGNDILCTCCEHLPLVMDYQQRLIKMTQFAAEEMKNKLKSNEQVSVLFGISERPQGISDNCQIELKNYLLKHIDNIDKFYQFKGGEDLGIQMLSSAEEIWSNSFPESLVLAIVDSYHNQKLLNSLIAEKKLFNKSTGEGIIAGEAAIFVKLSRNSQEAKQKIIFKAQSQSLKEILQALFSTRQNILIDQVIGNLNTRAVINEYFLSVTKYSCYFRGIDEYQTPLRYFGDTGAAQVFVMLMLDYILRQNKDTLTSLIVLKSKDNWSVLLIGGI